MYNKQKELDTLDNILKDNKYHIFFKKTGFGLIDYYISDNHRSSCRYASSESDILIILYIDSNDVSLYDKAKNKIYNIDDLFLYLNNKNKKIALFHLNLIS